MNNRGESEQIRSGEKDEDLVGSLVFFSMLLYDALLGIFAAIAYTFGDIRSAIVLALTGLLVFVGLTLQMLVGLSTYLRGFYGLSGTVVFFYVVANGGEDSSALFGAIGLTFGFVVVLGWRMAIWFLVVMALAVAVIFYGELYFPFGIPFSLVVELKFFVAFVGLGLLALGYGYVIETRLEGLQVHSERMSVLAYRDGMTNLPNRRSTEDFLNQRWEEYKRQGNIFAILLLNIDNFRELNNRYGRGFGDGVILRIAGTLFHGLRSQDVVSRWDGDEFLVILPGQNAQGALKVGERLRRRVEGIELVMHGRPVTVTVSVGAAAVDHSLGAEDLVSMAESGLFQAKHTGRNRVMLG